MPSQMHPEVCFPNLLSIFQFNQTAVITKHHQQLGIVGHTYELNTWGK